MSKQKMTLKRHLNNAYDLAMAKLYLDKIVSRCEKCFAKSTVLMKNINKINPNRSNGCFATIIKELNENFFSITDFAEHSEHGDIYSKLKEIAKDYPNMPKQDQDTIFIVGRHVRIKDTPYVDAWEFISATPSKENAIKQCVSDKYFYVPVYINRKLKDGKSLMIEAVYPKK